MTCASLRKRRSLCPTRTGARPRSTPAAIPMRSSRRMTAATGWVRVWRARPTRSARAAAASTIPTTRPATSRRSRPAARMCPRQPPRRRMPTTHRASLRPRPTAACPAPTPMTRWATSGVLRKTARSRSPLATRTPRGRICSRA